MDEFYFINVNLNREILIVPSQLEGKKVVSLSFYVQDFIFPAKPQNRYDWEFATITGVKKIVYGDTIEKIENIVFDLAYCQKDNELKYYQYLIDTLYEYMNLDGKIKVYDNRIREVLNYTEKCTCTVHTISFLADMVSLSRSRLSHLFREQVGIPLKSYIQFHQMQKAFFALLSCNDCN